MSWHLKERMAELEGEKRKLTGYLEQSPEPPALRLHPSLSEVYRTKICNLSSALQDQAGVMQQRQAAAVSRILSYQPWLLLGYRPGPRSSFDILRKVFPDGTNIPKTNTPVRGCAIRRVAGWMLLPEAIALNALGRLPVPWSSPCHYS